MKHVGNLIQAFVAGQLDEVESASVQDHLNCCAECKRLVRRESELWELLGQGRVSATHADSVWPAVRRRTVAAGRQAESRRFVSAVFSRTGAAAAAMAAGLLVGVLLPGGPVPEVAAEDSDADLVTWLTDYSWLDEEGGMDLGDLWLDAGLPDEGNES